MNINPNTIINFVICPLNEDNQNQLTFNSKVEQLNYFNSKPRIQVADYVYTRKDKNIVVNINFDTLQRYNYMFFNNIDTSDKHYFCFITNMEYVNENATRVFFKTDSFQTYQFDIVYQPSFIEREHTNNDSIGANTVPENLEHGEYITNGENKVSELEDTIFLLQATTKPNKEKKTVTNFGGVYSAGVTYVCESTESLSGLISDYDFYGNAEAVYNVYTAPKYLCKNGYIPGSSYSEFDLYNPVTFIKSINKPTNLAGYIPKNNKLYCYPYSYLTVHNNSGSAVTYNFENFSGSDCTFTIDGIPVVNSSIRLTPNNYKRNGQLFLESLTGGKYPVCNWSNDYYTNWITQNGVNLAVTTGSSLLAIGTGLATTLLSGSPTGLIGVGGGITGIINATQQIFNHSQIPDTFRGSANVGDITAAFNQNTFYFMNMCIKPEYAKIIDNYFSMYGYKTNLTKVPNIKGRKYWNYVKTINCNLDGDIPQENIKELKQMFNAGITLWHDPNNIYNYAQNNIIV